MKNASQLVVLGLQHFDFSVSSLNVPETTVEYSSLLELFVSRMWWQRVERGLNPTIFAFVLAHTKPTSRERTQWVCLKAGKKNFEIPYLIPGHTLDPPLSHDR